MHVVRTAAFVRLEPETPEEVELLDALWATLPDDFVAVRPLPAYPPPFVRDTLADEGLSILAY